MNDPSDWVTAPLWLPVFWFVTMTWTLGMPEPSSSVTRPRTLASLWAWATDGTTEIMAPASAIHSMPRLRRMGVNS